MPCTARGIKFANNYQIKCIKFKKIIKRINGFKAVITFGTPALINAGVFFAQKTHSQMDPLMIKFPQETLSFSFVPFGVYSKNRKINIAIIFFSVLCRFSNSVPREYVIDLSALSDNSDNAEIIAFAVVSAVCLVF